MEPLFIVEFFSNIINILMVVIFTLIGIILGVVIVRFVIKPKNQIQYLRERDGRGLELDIGKEDAISLETKSNPELRFFKYGRSYEFRKWGRAFTRFFGKEGTAYTWRLEGFSKVPTKFENRPEKLYAVDEHGKPITDAEGHQIIKETTVKIPVKWENKEISLDFPTLEDAVISKWGEEFYSTVPEQRKAMLRDSKMLVTVNLEPGIVPEGYEPITESVIKKKAKEDAAELIARSIKGAVKKTLYDWVFPALAGAGAMAIASKLLGWW